MAHFDALDVKAAAVFDVKVILCVLLGSLRATDLMVESTLFDVSFGRVDDIAFECERVSPNMQQVTPKNELVDALLSFLRKPEKWRQ